MATRFRYWATQHIKKYIVKGFVMDDERLKNPNQPFDCFEELLRSRLKTKIPVFHLSHPPRPVSPPATFAIVGNPENHF